MRQSPVFRKFFQVTYSLSTLLSHSYENCRGDVDEVHAESIFCARLRREAAAGVPSGQGRIELWAQRAGERVNLLRLNFQGKVAGKYTYSFFAK